MTAKKLCEALLSVVPADGTTIGNTRVRQALSERLGRAVDEAAYEAARDALVEEGVIANGQDRGGSVRFADIDQSDLSGDAPPALVLESPEPKAPSASKTPPKNGTEPAAPLASASEDARVLSYRHADVDYVALAARVDAAITDRKLVGELIRVERGNARPSVAPNAAGVVARG